MVEMECAPGERIKEGFVEVEGSIYREGGKVRLHLPDARDPIEVLVYNGKVATIDAIYRAVDGRIHIAVTLDEDPLKEVMCCLNFYPHELKVVEA